MVDGCVTPSQIPLIVANDVHHKLSYYFGGYLPCYSYSYDKFALLILIVMHGLNDKMK